MAGSSHPQIQERLQRLLFGLASRKPHRQAILAVESGDRGFRWMGAAGEADPDGTREVADIPFFIASIDKLWNAAVVMRLSETGRLDLDATLPAYLPSTLTRGLHRLGGVDHSERITLRHLLGHTSGLADWLEDRPPGGRSLVERVLGDGDLALRMEDVADIVRDGLKPHFPPQDPAAGRPQVRYSDTNYMLLVAVIEAVTGQPLYQVHEELVLRPLNLRHTYFPGHSRPVDPTPDPVVLRHQGRPLHIPQLLRSLKAMYSTAADSLSFLRGFAQGAVFDDPATLASMQRRWNRFGFPRDAVALRAPSWPIEYGLGIMRFRLPRVFTAMRPLPAVLGHTGSTGCWLFHCPEWDLLLAGSVDEVTAGAVPYRVVPRVLQIMRPSRPRPGKP